ncbi:MAG: cation transporter [Candidatus Latescibacteria bacterium]|nr:cation transporter [Candidatus Latescibacterota bacterium]
MVQHAHTSGTYDTAARAVWLIFALNLALCVAKLLAGWGGHSFALVADGINNLGDVGISVALLAGIWLARRPPDDNHAYGHGKLEQETSRVVGLAVLFTGALVVVEGIGRLDDQHGAPEPIVLEVAGVAILVKGFMYFYQRRVAARLGSGALAADALNHQLDIAATACVLAGSGALWLGGSAWAPADDAAAIAVGVLMCCTAGHVVYEASSELLDRMPPEDLLGQIRAIAQFHPGVLGVEELVGRKAGMHYLIDLHLEVAGEMQVRAAHALGHQVKARIMAQLPQIQDIVIHLEPADDALQEAIRNGSRN